MISGEIEGNKSVRIFNRTDSPSSAFDARLPLLWRHNPSMEEHAGMMSWQHRFVFLYGPKQEVRIISLDDRMTAYFTSAPHDNALTP
jgi:hypothetical protein